MSDSGKPRSYCTKRGRRVRRKRLEIWQMRSVRLMDNFNPPETDAPLFFDGICCRKKRRSGIDEAPSIHPGIAAAKGSKSDAGDRSLALEGSVSVSVSAGKSPEDGASPVGIMIASGKACEEGMSKSTCVSHGSISVIGRRRVMEDAVTAVPEMVPGEFSFFAVYDGHGGSRVANACRDRLHQLLLNELCSRKSPSGVTVVGLEVVGVEMDWEKVMMACFGKMDEEVSGGGETEADGASTSAATTVGSTAVVVLVGKEEIVVANCGDSRAVLGGGGGAVPLSHDHKPDRPDERERVEAIGGRVINWNGSRVLGVLATSRSIGDHYLKPYVISDPEVTVRKRTKSDNFLIIASDGLWDVVSNEVACDVVGECLHSRMRKRFSEETAAAEAAAILAELAMAKGSEDNISVIVVELQKYSS